MELLHRAHAVVADVTEPSFDLGYQLAMAEANRIPVLALVRGRQGEGSAFVESRLPATLVHNTGNWAAVVKGYVDAGEARRASANGRRPSAAAPDKAASRAASATRSVRRCAPIVVCHWKILIIF